MPEKTPLKRSTKLLLEHQSRVSNHFDRLFDLFLEHARRKAQSYVSWMRHARGHTSSSASTGLRQALDWIAENPEKLTIDDSDVFRAVVAAFVQRRCADAARREMRHEQAIREKADEVTGDHDAPKIAFERLQEHLQPLIESIVGRILEPLDDVRRLVVSWSLFDQMSTQEIERALLDHIKQIHSTGKFRGVPKKRRTIQLWIQQARQQLLTELGQPAGSGSLDEKQIRKMILEVVANLPMIPSNSKRE
jgi:hypothetical protein